ncbi:MAG: response regulator transcription factor [Erysipelotrichaceae bacterium]
MKKIAIVEDEPQIRDELQTLLQRYGYHVDVITDFEKTVTTVLTWKPDVVLLDINLPVFDGYYICRELRKASEMGIIVVTSRDSEWDELMSMNLGADDFVSKPYNTQILLARIANVCKRKTTSSQDPILSFGSLTLSLQYAMLIEATRQTALTKNEVHILSILIQKQGAIVSREELMESLWHEDTYIDDSTLSVNINRLRKKLAEVSQHHTIETRRGLGYCLV